MTTRQLHRRLERLEQALEPLIRYVTLEDLVLASYGRPYPEGFVWGGSLARAFEAQFGPKK